MAHALIVDDDVDTATTLSVAVASDRLTVAMAHTLRDARRQIALQPPDVVLLDLHLPDGTGLDLFADAELKAHSEVVLITGHPSLETSIQALRMGAADYLVKPVDLRHLQGVLSRFMKPALLQAEVDHLGACRTYAMARDSPRPEGLGLKGGASVVANARRETYPGSALRLGCAPFQAQRGPCHKSDRLLAAHVASDGHFGPLWGQAPAMLRVYEQISRVAGTGIPVFVTGESGTGKELVAQTVHALSRRREQPFLAVNCGAISPHLIESEIFGHEKGSFTGAERRHQGFFERASGGTLFLDEITEMPLDLQVRLLRVLETGRFMRVGSTQSQDADVRLIAATNRNPLQAVAMGRLREDLLYRLNVFPIEVPPLRERRVDVALLAGHFLAAIGQQEGVSKRFLPAALDRLAAHRWPGNVRELRNAVQRAYVMAEGETIDARWLPGGMADAAGTAAPAGPPARADALTLPIGTSMAQAERSLILATLQHYGHHRERAAAALGISVKTLYNRLKDYGTEAPGADAAPGSPAP
jgi:DNA-binding NtrC family response regulator